MLIKDKARWFWRTRQNRPKGGCLPCSGELKAFPPCSGSRLNSSHYRAIFNLGAVIGAAIEFGLTYDSSSNTVSNTVYAVFIAISGLASFLPALLVDPRTMVRSDGTRVIMRPHPSKCASHIWPRKTG